MHEHVGTCTSCGKPIYCKEGFLDGVVLEDKSLVCFECLEPSESPEPKNRFNSGTLICQLSSCW